MLIVVSSEGLASLLMAAGIVLLLFLAGDKASQKYFEEMVQSYKTELHEKINIDGGLFFNYYIIKNIYEVNQNLQTKDKQFF